MNQLNVFVFRLYERRNLRNWFYTIAFAIFVPVGYHFAELAWQYGSWYDKPLAVIAGLLIGIATLVTLLRIWRVPPKLVVTPPAPEPEVAPVQSPAVVDMVAVIRQRAAHNRDLASHAAALGSSMGRPWR
ncbi:MAG: hypothetical protein WDO73_25990 [Ignavibacteriota bacterium]